MERVTITRNMIDNGPPDYRQGETIRVKGRPTYFLPEDDFDVVFIKQGRKFEKMDFDKARDIRNFVIALDFITS